jgi:hypothetical protein
MGEHPNPPVAEAGHTPWWYTRDEEHLWGACASREEAIEKGIAEYEGDPFYICQGRHFRNRMDVFEIDWIADRFNDLNEDYAGEDEPSEAWTPDQCAELEAELNAVMHAWCVRHGHDKAYAIDASPSERIGEDEISALSRAKGEKA